MGRKILKATEGMFLTDGKTYGKEVYLADGMDESSIYEIPKSEIKSIEENNREAEIEDYIEALRKLGVDVNG